MEELVRRLIDDAVIVVGDPHWTVHAERLGALRLPPTLVGLLQARLDALPAGERQAARQASIVGHVFWDDALQALDADAPKALPALQSAAIVKDRDGSDFEGTPERQFDHHLLHQVTYETLLKSERKLGHGAAARWLAERTQGRGAEFLAMTGEHAERAGETALAIDCFDTAASEAVKRFANAAATTWLRRAVALLGESEAMRRFDLLHRLDEISELIGDRSAQDAVHADMAVLLEHHPDDSQQGRLLQRRALLAHRRGDRQASEQHALQAVALAERCGPAKTACQSHVMLSFIQLMRLDLERARSHADAALHWAARMEPSAETDAIEDGVRISSALVSIRMNRFAEARVALREALARREAQGSLLQQYGALHYLLEIESTLARYDEVLALAKRMQKLARSLGALPREVTVLIVLAEVSEAKGEQAAAIALYEQCLPMCRAANERRMEALVLFGLGRAHGELGDMTLALRWHSEAHSLFQDQGRGTDAIENEACIALCRTRLGQHTEALDEVNSLLGELDDPAADMPTSATIILRWTCQQVLGMSGDMRAGPVLAQLHADIQRRASELTDITDRDRLIQATPVFRSVVAAYRRMRGMSAPAV